MTVDVRDMLCAQALAVVARSMAALARGAAATVRYNAPDVKRDLVVWARDQGHRVREPDAGALLIEKTA
jgi:TusA-related sulfurtransferase